MEYKSNWRQAHQIRYVVHLSLTRWIDLSAPDDDECVDIADDTADDTADALTTWCPRGVVIISAPAHIQSSVCHRVTWPPVTRFASPQILQSRHVFLFLWQCLYFYCVYCVSLLARSARFEAMLANINGGIRFHIKIVCIVIVRLFTTWWSHSASASIGPDCPPPSLPSVFNSVHNFGENQTLRLSFAKLASSKWIINKLSRRVCDYPGLVNLSIGILVYFFLDKCKYNDAEGVLLAAQCPAGVTGGCWTQLKPNQGRGWVKTIMVCNELWTLELGLNWAQLGIRQVNC